MSHVAGYGLLDTRSNWERHWTAMSRGIL